MRKKEGFGWKLDKSESLFNLRYKKHKRMPRGDDMAFRDISIFSFQIKRKMKKG